MLPPACGDSLTAVQGGGAEGREEALQRPRDARAPGASERGTRRARPSTAGPPTESTAARTWVISTSRQEKRGLDENATKEQKGRDRTKMVQEMKMLSDLSLKHRQSLKYIFLKSFHYVN